MADTPYEDLPADSPLAFVRALVPDMEQLQDPQDASAPPSYLFDDATLTRYLVLAKSNIYLAAALACEAVAGSELLVLKSILTEDLQTNGDKVAKEWGAKAARLRRDAEQEEVGDNGGIFRAPYVRRPPQFNAETAYRRNSSRFGYI